MDRNILSAQVDDALVRCKKEFTKILIRKNILMNFNRKLITAYGNLPNVR
jgi:hypothetical protein